MKRLLAFAMLLGAAAPLAAADNYGVIVAGGTTRQFCGKDTGSILISCHYLVDATGAAFGVPGNPLYLNTTNGALESGHLATIDTSTAALSVVNGTKTDTGSTAIDATPASEVALLKGAIIKFNALIAALGTPAQAGGSIGNANFGITGVANGSGPVSGGAMRMTLATDVPLPATVDNTALGNLAAVNQAVTLTGLNGQSSIGLQLGNSFVGSVVVEYSKDNFATVKSGSYIATATGVTSSATVPLTTPGFYRFLGIAGYPQARARMTAYTSGTAAAVLTTSPAPDAIVAVNAIPQAFQETANGSAGVPLQQAGPANGLTIAGAVADGVSPGTFSPPVAGIDGGGLKRTLRTDTAGNVQTSALTDRIGDGAGNALTVQFATISASAAGSNTIVAAVAGKRIKVLGFFMLSAAADTVTWQDGATAVTGAMPFLANQGLSEATTPYGLFQTSVGNALTLNLSAASAVVGHLSYVTY